MIQRQRCKKDELPGAFHPTQAQQHNTENDVSIHDAETTDRWVEQIQPNNTIASSVAMGAISEKLFKYNDEDKC